MNVNQKALTIELFSTIFCVGRTKVFEEIKTGRLPTYKLGRRRYISAQAAANWQAALEAKASQPALAGVQSD